MRAATTRGRGGVRDGDQHDLDPVVVAHVAAGSKRHFRRLYDAMARRVYAFAMMRTQSPAAAEDVLQETMIAVWSARAKLRTVDSPRAWIMGVARNKCIDALRHDRVVAAHQATGRAEAALGDATGEIDLKEAIRALEPDQRELVFLVFIMGLRYDEVGEALGIPTGTVKSRMHRLRKELREAGINDG